MNGSIKDEILKYASGRNNSLNSIRSATLIANEEIIKAAKELKEEDLISIKRINPVLKSI